MSEREQIVERINLLPEMYGLRHASSVPPTVCETIRKLVVRAVMDDDFRPKKT